MTDRILIRGLRVETRVGVTAAERATPQTVVIDLDIEAEVAAAGASDELDDTIDYDQTVTSVARLVRGTETKLLEALAEKIASLVAAGNPVRGITVVVGKEKAPVSENVESIAVRIERPGR